jgi:hypothetical protein
MRVAASCAALALVAGCSVVPPSAWTFDPTALPPKVVMPGPELAELTDRVTQLQLERNDIRGRIAAQPDVGQRQALYAQLHAVGSRLSPLERRLATVAGGR